MEKRTEEFVMDGVVVYEAPKAEIIEIEIEGSIMDYASGGRP